MPVEPKSRVVRWLKPDRLEHSESQGNELKIGTVRKFRDRRDVLSCIASQSSCIIERLGHHPPLEKSSSVKRGLRRSSCSKKSCRQSFSGADIFRHTPHI